MLCWILNEEYEIYPMFHIKLISKVIAMSRDTIKCTNKFRILTFDQFGTKLQYFLAVLERSD